jgi:hypothetical protein
MQITGKRRIAKIVNFESTVVAAWDNQQFSVPDEQIFGAIYSI